MKGYARAAAQNSPGTTLEKQILNIFPGDECTQTAWFVSFFCQKMFGFMNQSESKETKMTGCNKSTKLSNQSSVQVAFQRIKGWIKAAFAQNLIWCEGCNASYPWTAV